MLSPRLYTSTRSTRSARPLRAASRTQVTIVALTLLYASLTSYAADWSTEPVPRRLVVGESIAAVIEELRSAGVPLAYSSALLPAGLRIASTPRSRNV
ncbi:MAG: hypothetical protein RIA65_17510, partial [Woeseia sp.]